MGFGSLSQTPLDVGGSTEATHRCREDYARNITDQSLPETVQVLRPPGTWTVPGAFAFFVAPVPAPAVSREPDGAWAAEGIARAM